MLGSQWVQQRPVGHQDGLQVWWGWHAPPWEGDGSVQGGGGQLVLSTMRLDRCPAATQALPWTHSTASSKRGAAGRLSISLRAWLLGLGVCMHARGGGGGRASTDPLNALEPAPSHCHSTSRHEYECQLQAGALGRLQPIPTTRPLVRGVQTVALRGWGWVASVDHANGIGPGPSHC